MNICILGDFSTNPDEGFKNIAYHISKGLSADNIIIKLNEKNAFSIEFWRSIQAYKCPQIIHYLTDPTLFGLVFLKVVSLYWGSTITITSALFPNISPHFKWLIPFFKPNLILIQTEEDDILFKYLNCKTRFLANGVDTDRFAPVSKASKDKLREKYGIPKDKFVVLHVGHIKKDRYLEIFNKIQTDEIQGLIVGSNYLEVNKKICRDLEKIGCILLIGYYKDIEEIYALSDCYIFPVRASHSILTPISVLEAMACNLPVVTRDFGGLKRIFCEGNGLYYAKNDDDFISSIELIKNGLTIKTREKILPYSWKRICSKLNEIYGELI